MVDLEELKRSTVNLVASGDDLGRMAVLSMVAISERLEKIQKTLERMSVSVDTLSLDLSGRKLSDECQVTEEDRDNT